MNFGFSFADIFKMYSESQFFRCLEWGFGLGLKGGGDLGWKYDQQF